jgi:hypothetical protein
MLQAVAMVFTPWFTTQQHTFMKARACGARSMVRRGAGGDDGARESELSGEPSGLLDCVCSRAGVHPVGSQSLASASLDQAAGNPVYKYQSHLVDESLAADRPSPGSTYSWRHRAQHRRSGRRSQPLISLSFPAARPAGPLIPVPATEEATRPAPPPSRPRPKPAKRHIASRLTTRGNASLSAELETHRPNC